MSCRAVVLLPLVMVALLASACAGSLQSGAPAPPLSVDLWLRGDGAQAVEPGRIYVVEHWATWCEPCIATMPHTDNLQRALAARGVEVLMVSTENAGTVSEFLARSRLERLALTFGVDRDGSMARDWFLRAPESVPRVFVVDAEGRFVFTGHPMEARAVVEWLLERPWDAAAFAQAQAEHRRLRRALSEARRDGRRADALAAVNGLLALGLLRSQTQIEEVRLQLADEATVSQAYEAARELAERLHHDADALNTLAWGIATDPGVLRRDLELALALAQRGCELTAHGSSEHVDTLARVHFERGELVRAVELQRQAVELAAGDERQRLGDVLAGYEAALAQAPTPRADDPFADDGDEK